MSAIGRLPPFEKSFVVSGHYISVSVKWDIRGTGQSAEFRAVGLHWR